MAIRLNEHAQALVAQRRARGREAALTLWVETLPVHGGTRLLSAGWTRRRGIKRPLSACQAGDVTVYVDQHVARYTQWHDITLSGWSFGRFEQLVVVDEPLVLRRLLDWERTHPSLVRPPAA